jgi:hypothetical protein
MTKPYCNTRARHTYPEVGEDILALHILSPQLDLTESLVLILLQVSQRDFEHTPPQPVGGNLSHPPENHHRISCPSSTPLSHTELQLQRKPPSQATKTQPYLGPRRPGDERLAQRPLREDGGSLNIIPVLLGERVDTAFHQITITPSAPTHSHQCPNKGNKIK